MRPMFTDKEHRILLSALSKEEKVCKKVDSEMNGKICLLDIVKSIEHKITALQYTSEEMYLTIPTPVVVDKYNDFFNVYEFKCPRCGDNFNCNEYEMTHCWSCGQALDWEDETKENAIKEYEKEKKNG